MALGLWKGFNLIPRFMHSDCFEVWQDNLLAFLNKLKDGGKRGKQWSDKQRVSVVVGIYALTLPI